MSPARDGDSHPRWPGAAAAGLWLILCARWFDVGAVRPLWFEAVPVAALALPWVVLTALWLKSRWPQLRGEPLGAAAGGLWLVVLVALAFRLPLVWTAAIGYLNADGALSGIVALHVRDGVENLVFVPHVPYSGSLKSHLTAVLAVWLDPARAFGLASVLFYGLFVAAVYRLALLALSDRGAAFSRAAAGAAGLYLAFAPAFVTRYSLSNDGNYVEVLALGSWALLLAARWVRAEEGRPTLALAGGILLGLAFWCHILALFHGLAFGLFLLLAGRARARRSLIAAAGGFVLGDAPGLLWNLHNDWASLEYVIPGRQKVAGMDAALPLVERPALLLRDQWPILLGYDTGYAAVLDAALWGFALAVVLLAAASLASATRAWWRGAPPALGLLLLFLGINAGVAFFALPQIQGNPRYLLFLMTPLPVLLARLLTTTPPGRVAFAAVVALGLLGSLAQWPSAAVADARWRSLATGLEREGVRHCYTDFWIATPVNFLSEERVICCSKLGPVTAEYFDAYRDAVEAAPDAAYVAVNAANAEKLQRKLDRLGVRYERRDLMKPVLLRLSRKVDPEELFSEQAFPRR